MFMNSIFLLLICLTIVNSIPCPSECICKPTDMSDVDFTRMSYIMDCSLNNNQLIYKAEKWSINEDKKNLDNSDDSTKDYIISIDLSKSLLIKKFTSKTIQLTDFSFSIQSLLLTNQSNDFILSSNSFNSPLYENLKILNLSLCCQEIPKDYQQLFDPLKNLEVLDLSGSDMYKICLKINTTFPKLIDLYLRNNIYDINEFSNTSNLFDGVRKLPGKLDLQNSIFQINSLQKEYCLFNTFQEIKTLDLSSIRFDSDLNDTEINLGYLLKCETQLNDIRYGEQLLYLYLRYLELEYLPGWFTDDRFPFLRQIDLSNNNFYSIDFSSYSQLRHISLAYNPIELNKIAWRQDTIYNSINLRSTITNQTFNLTRRLNNLLKITPNIDYSENEGNLSSNLTNFSKSPFSLNISRTNISSFKIDSNDLYHLDISDNFLIELNLTDQTDLNYLDCSNQYLKKLIFYEELTELIEFKCSNNSLKTIENFSLINIEKLKLIDLSYNLIDSLENLFSNLNTSRFLRSINLKNNSIQIIPSNIFHKKLFSLYEINLSWNQIHTIKTNAFQSPNLQILDLTGNSLINIEPQAILTISLRLFYIFKDTKQLNDRCIQSNFSDNLLSTYINWFEQNGTLMNNNQIEFDKCLNRYSNGTNIKRIIIKGKRVVRSYFSYIIIGLGLIGILFGGIFIYQRTRLTLLARFQRYKKLDKNTTEMDSHPFEDDEIVMNLDEPPYNKITRVSTRV